MFIGIGTLTNASTVLVGSTIGVLVGHRISARTRSVVTDGLGLVTLLIAASSATAVGSARLARAVGDSAPMLIVLAALLIGGIIGSSLRIEDRLEGIGGRLQSALVGRDSATHPGRARFIQGFVVSSMIFCVGPLTIVGSLTEGIGDGAQQLFLKSALDGFASIAFAASFGWGVAAAVVPVLVIQGGLTALGALLGNFLPGAHLDALTATGGLLLVGIGLQLLELQRAKGPIRVGDLLPALVVAPILTEVVVLIR